MQNDMTMPLSFQRDQNCQKQYKGIERIYIH